MRSLVAAHTARHCVSQSSSATAASDGVTLADTDDALPRRPPFGLGLGGLGLVLAVLEHDPEC